jgi:hypothetical protein
MKYHNNIHIKEIQSWIKQGTQLKPRIMNLRIQEATKLLSRVYAFCAQKKDMKSWIILLCLITLEQAWLNMWSYKMWQQHEWINQKSRS